MKSNTYNKEAFLVLTDVIQWYIAYSHYFQARESSWTKHVSLSVIKEFIQSTFCFDVVNVNNNLALSSQRTQYPALLSSLITVITGPK